MAVIEIPTRNDLPSYQQQVTLDGVPYVISLYFNARINNGVGKWFISIADQNSNLLCAPVPVVASWPLFDRFIDQITLPGTLFALDTAGNNEDPGQFDLGSRVRLYYIEDGTVFT